MSGAVGRNVQCPVKWCEEFGAHVVHRRYLASLPGGTRDAGMVGVNVAQRIQPPAPACVELTVTSSWASTAGYLLAGSCVPSIAAALIEAAEHATGAGRADP